MCSNDLGGRIGVGTLRLRRLRLEFLGSNGSAGNSDWEKQPRTDDGSFMGRITDNIRNTPDEPVVIPMIGRDRSNDMPGGTSRIASIRRLMKETEAGTIDPGILDRVKDATAWGDASVVPFDHFPDVSKMVFRCNGLGGRISGAFGTNQHGEVITDSVRNDLRCNGLGGRISGAFPRK